MTTASNPTNETATLIQTTIGSSIRALRAKPATTDPIRPPTVADNVLFCRSSTPTKSRSRRDAGGLIHGCHFGAEATPSSRHGGMLLPAGGDVKQETPRTPHAKMASMQSCGVEILPPHRLVR